MKLTNIEKFRSELFNIVTEEFCNSVRTISHYSRCEYTERANYDGSGDCVRLDDCLHIRTMLNDFYLTVHYNEWLNIYYVDIWQAMNRFKRYHLVTTIDLSFYKNKCSLYMAIGSYIQALIDMDRK